MPRQRLVGDLVVAGSADGYVYALRATDGALAWKFLAARALSYSSYDGSISSRWPVGSSVLHYKGSIYAIAGHHSSLEDGFWVWRLNPVTGAIEGRTNMMTTPDDYRKFNETNYGKTRRLRGLLIGTGDTVVHRGDAIDLGLSQDKWVSRQDVAEDLGIPFHKQQQPTVYARQLLLSCQRNELWSWI